MPGLSLPSSSWGQRQTRQFKGNEALACDAYWAEDPCGPDIPQSVDLTGGDAGERRVFSIQAEPLVSSACDGGVPDGDHGGADTEGSGRNR